MKSLSKSIQFISFFSALAACVGCGDKSEPVDRDSDASADGGSKAVADGGSQAVYVSAQSGNDTNPGTQEKPVKTVLKGLELAKKNEVKEMRVCAGEYVVEDVIKLEGTGWNRTKLEGGYDCTSWDKPSTDAGAGEKKWATVLKGKTPSPVMKVKEVEGFALSGFQIEGVQDPQQKATEEFVVSLERVKGAVLSDFKVKAPDGQPAAPSSFGVLVVSSQKVEFANGEIEAGKGHDGAAGTAGAEGSGAGVKGGDGIQNGQSEGAGGVGTCNGVDVSGGKGGKGWPASAPGQPGQPGQPSGKGGARGNGGNPRVRGVVCTAGREGQSGGHGTAGVKGQFLLTDQGLKGPGEEGKPGEPGAGGGGGGGGEIAGGGGGGSGGCEGEGGKGGAMWVV